MKASNLTGDMKRLVSIQNQADTHWVGDGFPVRTIFSYQSLGEAISPFLLLDYADEAWAACLES